MKMLKLALSALGTALILAGCGGGGSGTASSNSIGLTSMVVFGDSLSDIGTYSVGTIKALGGGKWSVNSPTNKNWTESIAAQYNLPTPCPAQTGLFGIAAQGFAAPVANFSACRNYAQGSSRVTNPAGPGSVAIQQGVFAGAKAAGATDAQAAQAGFNAAPLGLLALPVVSQMANHLTNAGGMYSGKELVTIMAGGNDVFLNLNGVASAAGGGSGAVGAAQFAGWSASVQNAVAGGGAAAAGAAQQAAVAGMAQAATELVAAVNTQVLAKGAKYVAIVNLPDVSQTPFALGLDAATRGFINTMVTAFNSTLNSGLAGKPGVIIVDAYTQGRDQVANPGQYTLSNVTARACDNSPAKNPLGGSSLVCTANNLIAGDTSKYLFADDVHLTPFANLLLAQFVTKNLITAGWQ